MSFLGIILFSSIFFTNFSSDSHSTEDDGDTPPIDPAALPFNQRWYFNASIDKSTYHHGEDITLRINFTCLLNHTMPYFTSYFWPADYLVLNGTEDIVQDFPPSSSITFVNKTFIVGQKLLSQPYSFHLASYNGEIDTQNPLWIKYLPYGTYFLYIEPPQYFKDGPFFFLEFEII